MHFTPHFDLQIARAASMFAALITVCEYPPGWSATKFLLLSQVKVEPVCRGAMASVLVYAQSLHGPAQKRAVQDGSGGIPPRGGIVPVREPVHSTSTTALDPGPQLLHAKLFRAHPLLQHRPVHSPGTCCCATIYCGSGVMQLGACQCFFAPSSISPSIQS